MIPNYENSREMWLKPRREMWLKPRKGASRALLTENLDELGIYYEVFDKPRGRAILNVPREGSVVPILCTVTQANYAIREEIPGDTRK